MNDITSREKKLREEEALLRKELLEISSPNAKEGDWEARMEEADDSIQDENEIADRFNEFEERSATVTVLKTRLEEVETALQKIKLGTYGMCEVCGAPIEEDRLTANVAARTCIKDKDL